MTPQILPVTRFLLSFAGAIAALHAADEGTGEKTRDSSGSALRELPPSRETLASAVKGDPYNEGHELVARDRFTEALPYLEEALRLDVNNFAAWRDLFMSLQALNRGKEASALLRHVVKEHPEFVEGAALLRRVDEEFAAITRDVTLTYFSEQPQNRQDAMITAATFRIIEALDSQNDLQGKRKTVAEQRSDGNFAAYIFDSMLVRKGEKETRLPSNVGTPLFSFLQEITKVRPDADLKAAIRLYAEQKYAAYLASVADQKQFDLEWMRDDLKQNEAFLEAVQSGKITKREAVRLIETNCAANWDRWTAIAVTLSDGTKAIRNKNGEWFKIVGVRTDCRLVDWD